MSSIFSLFQIMLIFCFFSDIYIKISFYDINNSCVAIRYFNSKFFWKAAAQDIYKKYNKVYLSWMKANFCKSLLMDPM